MATLRTLAVWLPWMALLLCPTSLSSSPLKLKIPRLNVHGGINYVEMSTESEAPSVSKDLETFYYEQTLDHFNYKPESYATFKQRYVINFKHWASGEKAAPILAYLGAEASIDGDINGNVGCLSENAPRFRALQVYIEHRFYGKSAPFGVKGLDLKKNATLRGYFNSAQALGDYAEILLHIKKTYDALDSPIIVMGGSYGGMLATYFRLKYPHIAMGALASSAPVLYFENITPPGAYYDRVAKDFRDTSNCCHDTIKSSWKVIDEVGAENDGLAILSKKFKTCKPLKDTQELKNYLDTLYTSAAQYDSPYKHPVESICRGIDGESKGRSDILDRIFSGVFNYHKGNLTCLNLTESSHSPESFSGWGWQSCTDFVMPIGIVNNTMFPADPFNLRELMDSCYKNYGVLPRPHWVTTYYGGHDFREVLKRFGSNIIFSNGLRDPYSTAGVVENISDTLIALTTPKGSHCLDIVKSRRDDPNWLVKLRRNEVKIMKSWTMQIFIKLGIKKIRRLILYITIT